MKRIVFAGIVICFSILVTMQACKPDPNLDVVADAPFGFTVPEGWPKPFYNFENNAVTKPGFELGRKLFYDPRLSRTNEVSCGSCHQPSAAFAQLDHPISHGVEDKLGTRNSPSIFNMNWHTSFFWDGGVNHLESQPINPIQNPVEMDETLDNIIAKLKADANYPKMFKAAFGDEMINSQRIFKAFAQFMGMMVSSNAKYDKYKRGEAGASFTAAEQAGYTVFKNNCATCHIEPLFTDFSFRNNGLAPTSANDTGRAHITQDAADKYKFKVPSLRNLRYTWPYMHDGRYNNLDDVLNHYTKGITQSGTLDPLLKDGIQLTDQERSDLLAFLNTLNDEEFVKDPRFQEVN